MKTTATATKEGADLVKRRHPEFLANEVLWRRLLDSWEGGEAYRDATYGRAADGTPVRNLVRHKREYPTPGERLDLAFGDGLGVGGDPHTRVGLDDYEARRARTPPPRDLAQAVQAHLAKIFQREVKRSGPEDWARWTRDVNVLGDSLDFWMREAVGPLLLVCGQLDVVCDRPAPPDGETITSQADVQRLGLDRCVATHVLPTNVVWWRLRFDGQYDEVLIREWHEDEMGKSVARFRHWTSTEQVLHDADGAVLSRRAHPYGRVPVVRCFFARRPRARHVGTSPYEAVADLERERYNTGSEIVLSNTLHAHPVLQGPESAFSPEGELVVGPGHALPMALDRDGRPMPWSFLDPPKGAYQALRQQTLDLGEEIQRITGQTKPAGAVGATVAQSGLSKALDQESGSALLGRVAAKLARFEVQVGRLAVRVLRDGAEPAWRDLDADDDDQITATYPVNFNLLSASEVATHAVSFTAWLETTGQAPDVEIEFGRTLIRRGLPGLDDARYAELDAALEEAIAGKARERAQAREALSLATRSPDPEDDPEDDPDADETDETEAEET